MFDMHHKISTALNASLRSVYPSDTLLAFTMGLDRLSIWLEILFLGPIAIAAGSQAFYIGLTQNRLYLLALSVWTYKPTSTFHEIPLSCIEDITFKRGIMGKLDIHYTLHGQKGIRRMHVAWVNFDKSRYLVSEFSKLSPAKPTTSDIAMLQKTVDAYQANYKKRIQRTVVTFVLLLVLFFVVNILPTL